jgi:transglutaminase-like putative cysteine protease
MRLNVVHSIRYDYSDAVYLEPHMFRMSPLSGVRQRVLEHRERIQPEPRGQSQSIDLEGNQFTLAWFDGEQNSLEFSAETVVETTPVNPFNFLITAPACAVVPVRYPDVYEKMSAPYRERVAPSQEVSEYAWSIAEAAGLDATGFLLRLAQTLANDFDHVEREMGAARPPLETLSTRYGACRDIATLYVDACRSMRLAARFVSGYVHNPEAPHAHLHAWAEVFLPGPGWRGYDPSAGLAETENYVTCSRAAALVDAAPVRGAFRSSTADSTMTATVAVTELS